MKMCSHCGAVLEDYMLFCNICGMPVETDTKTDKNKEIAEEKSAEIIDKKIADNSLKETKSEPENNSSEEIIPELEENPFEIPDTLDEVIPPVQGNVNPQVNAYPQNNAYANPQANSYPQNNAYTNPQVNAYPQNNAYANPQANTYPQNNAYANPQTNTYPQAETKENSQNNVNVISQPQQESQPEIKSSKGAKVMGIIGMALGIESFVGNIILTFYSLFILLIGVLPSLVYISNRERVDLFAGVLIIAVMYTIIILISSGSGIAGLILSRKARKKGNYGKTTKVGKIFGILALITAAVCIATLAISVWVAGSF